MIFFPIIPMGKDNHCVAWCPLYRLILVWLHDMLLVVIFKEYLCKRYWISVFKTVKFFRFFLLWLITKQFSGQKVWGSGLPWPPGLLRPWISVLLFFFPFPIDIFYCFLLILNTISSFHTRKRKHVLSQCRMKKSIIQKSPIIIHKYTEVKCWSTLSMNTSGLWKSINKSNSSKKSRKWRAFL